MKNLSTLLLILVPFWLLGQNDAYHDALLTQLQNDYALTGGSWVLTGNETTNTNNAGSYGGTYTVSNISGQVFTRRVLMDIPNAGNNPWDAGYGNSNLQSVNVGDRVLLVVWLRTADNSPNPCKASIFIENSTTYFKEIYLTVNPGTEWQQYFIPIQSTDTYTPQTLNIGFHMGYQAQVMEMGGMTLINYGQSVPYSQLPQEFHLGDYEGSDPNAPWRAAAASRIEQHRKADMSLEIQDDQGNPLANQPVRVEMLRHEFAFGTAVVPRRLAGNSANDPTYASKLLDLDGNGHGFNWVVTENALKWRAWEQGWAGSPAETVNALQWLTSHQIQVRGHVLVWPGWQYMPDDMQLNSGNPGYMEDRIDSRLDAILNYQGVRDVVTEWDVINEIAHVRDLENALQGTPSYTTGREIYADILNQALVEDSRLINYINDYNILSNGSVKGGDYVLFKSMLQEVVDAGGQLDGVGLQGHMGSNLIAPDSLYAILEDCHQAFGLPIKITEYDQDSIIDDETAAQYTGDFLTMVFSHPAVNGFLMWGFWDGAHWLGNAPLFHMDWTPKPALGTFNSLVFDEWWTDTIMNTNAQGILDLRGFKGDYRIRTSLNGTDFESSITLNTALDTTLKMTIVGLDDAIRSEFQIYPNPVQNQLFLKMPYLSDWKLEIHDALGRTWITDRFTDERRNQNIQTLKPGLYIIRLEDREGNPFLFKVIKE